MPYKSNGKWKWGNLKRSSKDDLRKTVYWIWKKNGSKGDFSHFWKTGKVNEKEPVLSSTMSNDYFSKTVKEARQCMEKYVHFSPKSVKVKGFSDKEVKDELIYLLFFIINGFMSIRVKFDDEKLKTVIRNCVLFEMQEPDKNKPISYYGGDVEDIVSILFDEIERFVFLCYNSIYDFCLPSIGNSDKKHFSIFAKIIWSTIYEGFETDEPSIYVKPSIISRDELHSIFDSKKISIGNLKAFNESIKRWIKLTEK